MVYTMNGKSKGNLLGIGVKKKNPEIPVLAMPRLCEPQICLRPFLGLNFPIYLSIIYLKAELDYSSVSQTGSPGTLPK